MTRISAKGRMVKPYEHLGMVLIVVEGDDYKIKKVSCTCAGSEDEDPAVWAVFEDAMKEGPSYPACAEPNTMLCAQAVLCELFGNDGTKVKTMGPIRPMNYEYDPEAIY